MIFLLYLAKSLTIRMNFLKKQTNRSLFLNLWSHLSRRRHKQFFLLLTLMFITSIAEVVSIGAVLPFLGVLTAPEQVYQHPLIQPVNQLFSINTPDQLILPLSVFFIVSALFAGAVRLTLLYVATRFSYAIGADLSINIYNRTLYQDYEKHASRNSSEVIDGVITKTNIVIGGVVTPMLTLISSIVIIMAIIATLFVIDPVIALAVLLGFGLLYLGVIFYTRNRIIENGKIIASQSKQMVKSLQEGLGGIRDVLIDGSQQFYCDLYRKADLPLRRASGDNEFISAAPRYAMEALGMMVIAVIAYSMTLREEGLSTAIPILGALALGGQRLLPVLQQAYSSYSKLKGSSPSLKSTLFLLDQSLPRYALKPKNSHSMGEITFEREIRLKNINFHYVADRSGSNTSQVLKNVNLTLTKGSRIGFIGTTGSGKSTLLDIIMGLLHPVSGEVIIDGQPVTSENRRSWQMHIAHVSQNIYLSDGSIEENIAFGIPREKIDHQQVRLAAKQAKIAELIDGWQEGYQTLVGERGMKLSGGQKQRIGIARALYKRADVLVLDEATSALDNETERAIMESIENLGRGVTVFMIAHRLTTLEQCDQIVKLGKGNQVYTGTFQEMISDGSK